MNIVTAEELSVQVTEMDKEWDGTKHGKKDCDFSKVNQQAGRSVENVLALLGQHFCHLTMRRLCASVCPEIMSFLEQSQYFPECLESALRSPRCSHK